MKRVIILGGGYSVREGIDKNLWQTIQGMEVWSLNSCFKAMPWLPSKQFFVDRDFWRHDADDMQGLYEKNVPIVCREMGKLLENRPELTKYPVTRVVSEFNGVDGLKKNLLYSGNMGLVGIFALHYAVCQDYDEIYLLGYDFGSSHVDNKFTHWYQSQIPELNIQSYGAARPEVYLHKEPGHVNEIRKDIEDFKLFANLGKNIYNVSMGSHISYFPKISYEQFFNQIRKV